MTRTLPLALLAVAAALACGPKRVATTPAERELLVLLPGPDGASSGHATVTGSSAASA